MSYDIYVGYSGPSHNYTSNIARMLMEAGFSWDDLHKKPVRTARRVLRRTIRIMESDPPRFMEFNPKNGWGDYETCVAWLKRILEDVDEAAQYAPETRMYVSA